MIKYSGRRNQGYHQGVLSGHKVNGEIMLKIEFRSEGEHFGAVNLVLHFPVGMPNKKKMGS